MQPIHGLGRISKGEIPEQKAAADFKAMEPNISHLPEKSGIEHPANPKENAKLFANQKDVPEYLDVCRRAVEEGIGPIGLGISGLLKGQSASKLNDATAAVIRRAQKGGLNE